MEIQQFWTVLIWGFAAAGAFAVLFNVPVRTLLWAALGGALGLLVRNLILQQGSTLPLASFIGAFAIGIWSAFWSHRVIVPGHVISIPAMIPMIPGVLAFRTMMGFLNFTDLPAGEQTAALAETAATGIQTLTTLLAISFGIAIPNILDRVYLEKFKFRKRVRE